jgi:TRAP-type C4-dicarboxylate transport system substrate-binding protein
MSKFTHLGVLTALAAVVVAGSVAAAPVTLRASHQFPGGKGDVRDEMVQIIARDAKAAGVDLDVQVYPGASLFNRTSNGTRWSTASSTSRLSARLRQRQRVRDWRHAMPGLVTTTAGCAAGQLQFMKDIGPRSRAPALTCCRMHAGRCRRFQSVHTHPDDIKGQKIRSAGPTFAAMWQAAGASIVSVPSNEVYNALQTGVAEATDTSTGSFVSFRIYEQVKCITAPGENALWFMYEPVLMSKKSFDRLDKKQQEVLLKAGKKAQDYFAKEAKGLDDEMIKVSGSQGRSRHVDARRIRRLDQHREAELVRGIRQGSPGRQAVDR